MDYYRRDQIPVLSFDEEVTELDQSVLREAMYEKPCNAVFIEVRGKLYGIISRGDISRAKRAGRERIPVNCSFTSVREKRLMEAREIFREKENIREIPVADGDGKLLGMCSRNDDLLFLEYSDPWEENRYVRPFLGTLNKVLFVKAPARDERRRQIIERWISEFEKSGVVCEQISLRDLPETQNGAFPVLVVDEETMRGAGIIMEALGNGVLNTHNVHTFRVFESTLSEHGYDDIFMKLADSGIKVYNMFYTEDESTEGRRRLFDGMRSWLQKPETRGVNPYVVPSCAQDFYGELNVGDYAQKVGRLYFGLETNSIYTRMKDTSGPYLNIVNGERVTVGQPEEADRTIWFFGPCFILGGYVEDKHTIESFLQEKINRAGYSCKVVNYGCYESPYQRMIRITSTPMKPGDIVVMHVVNRPVNGTESIDLMDILDRNEAPAGWLLNLPVHCNHKANRLFADDLFERMVKDGVLTGGLEREEKRSMLSCELAVNSLYLDLHFNDFHPKEGEKIGFVGMHGNPFTRGHRYLIETASKQVDRLIVTIIEDELGIFSYAERFAMAVEGTRDLPNVRIVPAGPFQATRNVFQEYFVRVEPTAMRESATVDTLIFAEIIAKRLEVTYRFLGDEKHNPKMQFFNELVKEILPAYGIEAVELPRAQADGHAISASVARKAGEEGDRKTLLANVPESTLKFFFGADS